MEPDGIRSPVPYALFFQREKLGFAVFKYRIIGKAAGLQQLRQPVKAIGNMLRLMLISAECKDLSAKLTVPL